MQFQLKPFWYAFGHGLFRAAMKAYFPIRILHRERLLEEGPAIIVANHQSFLDPPLMCCLYTNPLHFLARHTLWCNAFMRWFMPISQSIPINQERPDPARILEVIRTVRKGERIVIFPEGSRTPDGEMHEAMPGIGLILSKLPGVPVQPVRIEGAYESMPIHRNTIRRVPLTLSVGEPIIFTEAELKVRGREAQRAIGKKLMDAIAALPKEP